MSQELDSGTLILLVLFGYWYWWICRSIGSPPANIEASKIARSRLTLPHSKDMAGLRTIGDEAALSGRLVDPGSEAAEALWSIRRTERSFDAPHFLKGAVTAYDAILTAFANGDASALAGLTTADVYRSFVTAIAERHEQQERLEWTLLRIEAARIVDAALDGRSASITVRFSGQFITSRRSDPRDPVGEACGSVVDTTDDWTFARELLSRDPNWKLMATATA